ncbi:MAG: SOS response-associated peptidase [Desulfobacterales bacterium]|nr:SOS response-associated peptidase [Desulfobacterales bacterium]
MCGRFAQYSSLNAIKGLLSLEKVTCDVKPSYNVAPSRNILAVINHNGNRLGKLSWGFIPSWAKNIENAPKHINARMETINEKPTFKTAFRNKRCLIPADGYYEWEKTEKGKQPWYITLPSGKLLFFAGLWQKWGNGESALFSCTIITASASESVSDIHHRMPVILSPDKAGSWLYPDLHDDSLLLNFLKTNRIMDLKTIPVSKYVNSVANNSPQCVEPLSKNI